MDNDWILGFVNSPWLFAILFLLIVADAFLVILPSETAVIALAALAGATGAPSLAILIPVAAIGAIVGDSSCYGIGRATGHNRWRWQSRGRLGLALARARATVLARPASLIFTARYVPFARIAVNLSAGAVGLPYRRFLPLSIAAGVGWALYNSAVGLFFGRLLGPTPIVAVLVSVVVAIGLGVTIDLIVGRVSRLTSVRPVAEPPTGAGDQG